MSYLPALQDTLRLAEEEIFKTYGDRVSFIDKAKSLVKFGRRASLASGSFGTIADLGTGELHETYLTTNGIDSVNSNNAGDTSLGISYEGHTLSGSDWTFVTGTATTDGTNGQTRVALSTPVNRISRMRITSGGAPTGDIIFHENGTLTGGEPNAQTEVHGRIPAGRTQSFKNATSLSSTDYLVILDLYCALRSGTPAARTADFNLEISEASAGVSSPIFQPRLPDIPLGSDNNLSFDFPVKPYIIVPKNSDVRQVAKVSGASVITGGSFGGFLAGVQ